MKYKLKHINTGEEHLCDKVTIDGFDYYVSDEKEVEEYNKAYFAGQILTTTYFDSWFLIWNFVESSIPPVLYKETPPPKKVIATNNPNIDIPKVVDEVEELAEKLSKEYSVYETGQDDVYQGIIVGYNKSQEKHPNSDEDVIEFYKWVNQPHPDDNRQPTAVYVKNIDMWWYNHKKYTSKEIIQLWKEQQPKIVYYE